MHGHSKDLSNLQARFIKHLSLLSFTSMSSYSSTFFNSFFPLAKNIGFIVILASLLFQRAHFCCDGRNTWTDESIEVNSIAKGWSDNMMR